jgi:hypothetical protein
MSYLPLELISDNIFVSLFHNNPLPLIATNLPSWYAEGITAGFTDGIDCKDNPDPLVEEFLVYKLNERLLNVVIPFELLKNNLVNEEDTLNACKLPLFNGPRPNPYVPIDEDIVEVPPTALSYVVLYVVLFLKVYPENTCPPNDTHPDLDK